MSPPSKTLMKRPVMAAPVNDAATGPSNLVSGIIRLIDELVLVMDAEIALVEARKMTEHAELLKRKQRLTIDYRSSLKSIALQPDCLKLVPKDLRQSALEAGQKLSAATQRNAKVLRAAILAVERLAKTIIGMVKEEVLPKGGYANTNLGKAKKGYSPTCKPVTGVRTA